MFRTIASKFELGVNLNSSAQNFRLWIYHNYIRPHMTLESKTPSESCGIKIEGDNRWLTIIQNASNNS